MTNIIKLAASLTKKDAEIILGVAKEIGDKLGKIMNDAIDEVFDKAEQALIENQDRQ